MPINIGSLGFIINFLEMDQLFGVLHKVYIILYSINIFIVFPEIWHYSMSAQNHQILHVVIQILLNIENRYIRQYLNYFFSIGICVRNDLIDGDLPENA